MQSVPLQPIASQVVNCTLNNQAATISVYQLTTGLFCDLYVSNVLVIAGVICQNVNRIVRDAYLGFVGDILFVDTKGNIDPDYTGLGGRFQLIYLNDSEIESLKPFDFA